MIGSLLERKTKTAKKDNHLKLMFSYISQAIFFKLLQSNIYTETKKKRCFGLEETLSKIFFFELLS